MLRAAEERAARIRFRRAVSLMVLTLLVPGSAQLLAGNRLVGRIALRLWLTIVSALAVGFVLSLMSQDFVFWFASNTTALGYVRWAMILVAVGWGALLVDAWRIGEPLSLLQGHRRAAVALNGVLCLGVVAPLLYGAHMVGVSRDFVTTVFGDGEVTEAVEGRYNVLLLGGDSGAGRWGLRPDSLTVASIDAGTGETILFGLPRNMADFPFAKGSVMEKQFPDGFDCEGCMLNGVATWAGDHTDLFKGSKTPGIDATVMAVEGITGLDVNYWVMVNLQGFEKLVDAVGGVRINVRDRIPVGIPSDDFFTYLEPGDRVLNGHDTLWFARAREGSDDYSRMARQKCVMKAMLDQISPQTMLRNFSEIAEATSGMVETDLPASELGDFVDLALKAKSAKVSTVSFVPPLINTGDPDIDLIHSKVEEAIAKAEGTHKADPGTGEASEGEPSGDATTDKPRRKRKVKPEDLSGGSIGSMTGGYVANETEDLGAAC